MINRKVIEKLNPCPYRFNNFIKEYGDRDFTVRQFMGLRNITQSDKLWVAFRLMPKEKIRFAVADIAELVLPIFEKQYPNDDRPRKAIAAARNTDLSVKEVINAAYDAYVDAAYAADAAHAVAAAAAADAAAADADADSRKITEKKIRTIILRYWK